MTLTDHLNKIMVDAFDKAGLPTDRVSVQTSDRPDLADFQCNTALQLAKVVGKNPREIATSVLKNLDQTHFEKAEIAGPGFINLVVKSEFLSQLMNDIQSDDRCGCPPTNDPKTIVVDYGGPNVAKPLHVGHLRPAIIGEAVKRISRFSGNKVIGDIHLGDWGTPMGMLIAELSERQPNLPYFEEGKTDGFPSEPPVSVDELNTLYPESSTHFKSDETFADKAREATAKLQNGHAGYRALWQHFRDVSLKAMKEDYARLNVEFDLWLGESDAHDLIPNMIEDLRKKNLIEQSDGALIVHVAEDEDKEEIPPLILVKKDGGYNYATTDLATIYDRVHQYKADEIIYVVDTRQSLHFKQVFRAAVKAGYIKAEQLEHANFGTINGKDGKPFKTRDGGVMRLQGLIDLAGQEALKQAGFNDEQVSDEIQTMIDQIAVAAVKYGDLSTNRQSDYIFDPAAFVQAEGKTGPYIQYASVRMKAILDKADMPSSADIALVDNAEKELVLRYLDFPNVIAKSVENSMPSILCEHAYLLSKSFSRFYGHCPVSNAEDESVRASRLILCQMVLKQLSIIMEELLGIDLPNRMLRAEEGQEAA